MVGESIVDPATSPTRLHQPGVSQDAQVVRQQVGCDVDLLDELADTALPVDELSEYPQTNRVTERGEAGCRGFNTD